MSEEGRLTPRRKIARALVDCLTLWARAKVANINKDGIKLPSIERCADHRSGFLHVIAAGDPDERGMNVFGRGRP